MNESKELIDQFRNHWLTQLDACLSGLKSYLKNQINDSLKELHFLNTDAKDQLVSDEIGFFVDHFFNKEKQYIENLIIIKLDPQERSSLILKRMNKLATKFNKRDVGVIYEKEIELMYDRINWRLPSMVKG